MKESIDAQLTLAPLLTEHIMENDGRGRLKHRELFDEVGEIICERSCQRLKSNFSIMFSLTSRSIPGLSSLSNLVNNAQQLRFRYQYLRGRTRVKRDMARRPHVAESEIERMVLKALHRDQRLPMEDRIRAMLALHAMPPQTRPNMVKARCVLTGKGNGVLAGFRVSRIVFRESGINGMLPGAMRLLSERSQ